VKAKEWLERGRASSTPIDAFSNFWRGFNSLYAEVTKKGDERSRIRAFLKSNVSADLATQTIDAHPQALDYLISQPVKDMRGNGKDTTSNIDAFAAAKSPQEKICELFMIIYQVRCNLEHGQKSPNRARDIELCRYSSLFVADVVANCA